MTKNNISIAEAMDVIAAAIHADPDYKLGWQANLAVMMQDAGVSHAASNQRAADFLTRAFPTPEPSVVATFWPRYTKPTQLYPN